MSLDLSMMSYPSSMPDDSTGAPLSTKKLRECCPKILEEKNEDFMTDG